MARQKKAPAFQFYAGDFLIGVASMPLDQRGAYITLLAIQWTSGSVPGDDMVTIGRLLGVSRATATSLWKSISGKFLRGPDGLWRNERMEEERAQQAEFRRRQSDKGKASAASKVQPEGNQTSTGTQPSLVDKQPQPDVNSSIFGLHSSGSANTKNPQTPSGEGASIRVRREHRNQAKQVLKAQMGYCKHQEPCANQHACEALIASQIARKAS